MIGQNWDRFLKSSEFCDAYCLILEKGENGGTYGRWLVNKSKQTLETHMSAFIALNNQTDWENNKEELEDIFLEVYGYQKSLNEKFTLRICADDDLDIEFIEKVKGYKFPNFYCLNIVDVNQSLQSEYELMREFLTISMPQVLKEFIIHGSDDNENLNGIWEPIIKLLPKVKLLIQFDQFSITQNQLKEIIEVGYSVRDLRITNGILILKPDFGLDKKITYSIKASYLNASDSHKSCINFYNL